MNKDVIETLEKEVATLYEAVIALPPRHEETNVQFFDVVKYCAYREVIEACKRADKEMSLEEAHKIIYEYIIAKLVTEVQK